ncbi:alpha/beta fold hydrolase [candidate division KSB1 bacterium]
MKKTVLLILTSLLFIAILLYNLINPEEYVLTDDIRRTLPGSFIELPDGVTHYETAGPEDGRPVLLVHGFSVPYYIWDPTFKALADSGFRVIRFDLYGRGYSDRPDLTYDAELFDRQITSLLDILKIDRPVDIAGLSMGGAVSVYFTANHPEKVGKLILIDPSFPKGARGSLDTAPVIGEFLTRTLFFPGMADSQLEDFYRPENFPDWADKFRVQMKYRGFQRAILSTIRNFMRKDFTPEYAKTGSLGKEALLIYGTEDNTISLDTMLDILIKIPHIEFFEIPEAGHIPPL